MVVVVERRGCRALALGRERKSGQLSWVGGPSKANIFDSWSTSFLPWKRGSLVRSSAKMQPKLQMSISEE